MHTLMVRKLCSNYFFKLMFSYASYIFSVIFVPVYLTSVCGVLASMTSLQERELRLFQSESGTKF